MMESRTRTCPLCTFSFDEAKENCHTSCAMSPWCSMIKCPRCDYEFVEDSSIVNFFRRMMRRGDSASRQEPNR